MADDTSIDDQINAARKQLQAGSGVDTTAPATTTAQPDDSATVAAINAARKSLGVVAGAVAPPDPIPFQTRSFTQDASDFGAGLMRGVGSVVLPMASGLSYLTSKLPTALQSPYARSSADISAENQAQQAQFEKDHPSAFGTAGTIAGQTAATLPVLAGAGGLVAKGGELLGDAIPAIKSGLTTAGTFLAGDAGGAGSVGSRALQAGSRATQGATQGVGASVLTGNTDPKSLALAAATGGVGGAAIPLAVEGGTRIAGTTSDMAGSVATVIDQAKKKFGIDLRATQVPGALPPTARVAQNLLKGVAGSGAGAETAPVLQQWRNAVAQSSGILPHVGDDFPALTPSAITNAQQSVASTKQWYENSASSLPDIAARLSPLVQASSTVGGADAPVLGKMFKGVMDAADQKVPYGNILADLDQQAKLSGSPTVQRTIAATKNAVQDALQDDFDTIPRMRFGDPADGSFYSRLRTEEHNLGVLQKARLGQDGQITPETMRDALAQSEPYQGDSYKYVGMPVKPSAPGETGYRYHPSGNELTELSNIGAGIGKAPDTLDKLLKLGKYAEYPIAAATHLLSGGAVMHLPVTLGIGGAASAAANLTNRYLASKGLVNRLSRNYGQQSQLPNMLQPYAGAPSALTANAQ